MNTCVDKNKPRKQEPNLYSHDVLNGNWFERRWEGHIDKKAITPAITGRSDCIAHKSIYKSDYLPQIPRRTMDEIVYDLNMIKVEAFRNHIYGTVGNIKMHDGDRFVKNITTTSDISYRIIPNTPPPRNLDVFGVYGNATKTGLLLWNKCQEKKIVRSDMSVTKTDYVPLPIKPIVIVKGKK